MAKRSDFINKWPFWNEFVSNGGEVYTIFCSIIQSEDGTLIVYLLNKLIKEGWIDIRPRFNPKILFEKLGLYSSNYTPIIS